MLGCRAERHRKKVRHELQCRSPKCNELRAMTHSPRVCSKCSPSNGQGFTKVSTEDLNQSKSRPLAGTSKPFTCFPNNTQNKPTLMPEGNC